MLENSVLANIFVVLVPPFMTPQQGPNTTIL